MMKWMGGRMRKKSGKLAVNMRARAVNVRQKMGIVKTLKLGEMIRMNRMVQ
jgi:hypothetical protein